MLQEDIVYTLKAFMSCAAEKFEHVKYFEHTTFSWLPLDLDINVKDCLSFCSVAFGDRGV